MRILFFAHLKDVTGRSEFHLPCRETDADGLWAMLNAEFPDLSPFRRSVRLAKNSEYVGPEARFNDGDEVALIPPVSGG
jgi:molybdopterin converting factor subunit 1